MLEMGFNRQNNFEARILVERRSEEASVNDADIELFQYYRSNAIGQYGIER
jgi:hypothetical protein